MSETGKDRIEASVVVRATRRRVWRAISDAKGFGQWFGAKLEGAFAVGEIVKGHVTSPGYEHIELDLLVEKMAPEQLFAYAWHPYAMDPAVDYSAEPRTLVEFRLEGAEGGTRVTVVESGFDQIPEARRSEAYEAHVEGWAEQMENIKKYVARG